MSKVLILTPIKDAVFHLNRYFANLEALDVSGLNLSLGMLESDSSDATFNAAQTGLVALSDRIGRRRIWKRDFGFRLPPGKPRWAPDYQLPRRTALARARNHLLMRALDDEDWVLWLDVDVIEYPADLIQRLLAYERDIIHPHCVLRHGGPSFDHNAWAQPNERRMDSMRDQDIVPLDSVGGSCLLVKADLHRDGLIFPPYLYGRPHPRARRPGPWRPLSPGEIETEGLALMANDMGVSCWGLPRLEVTHFDG